MFFQLQWLQVCKRHVMQTSVKVCRDLSTAAHSSHIHPLNRKLQEPFFINDLKSKTFGIDTVRELIAKNDKTAALQHFPTETHTGQH